ncbi:nucleotidyltransferase [Kineococcus sp. T13]|uniref:nucleotidyltransferase domain-containing protein n=1 Tax=Kineococcus vitellinus TaxID=2696565 RepID=UPI001412E6FC|nr:nucleotidyltransferase domain-containing protein [Kineococcus vitellinus]NAZ77573.1 nucleotidyltransferase [Kineococcus vitellinus]
MTARLKGRRRHADRLLDDLTRWAQGRPHVQALAVVGSYARGHERMASDVDVVILTEDIDSCSLASGWFDRLRPGSMLVRAATWGPVREQRYRLRSGLLAEIGLAPTAWADVPLDAGTRRVLGDGHRILHDPHTVLARAAAALEASAR